MGIGTRLAKVFPLGLYRKLVSSQTVGVNYHLIGDDPAPHCPDPYVPKSAVSFEQDLLALKRHFHPISYEDLSSSVQRGGTLPPRAVIVTCDDGFSECFSVMRPLLLKHSVPCAFFLTINLLDNLDMLFQCKVSLCLSQLRTLSSFQRLQAEERLRRLGVGSLMSLGFPDREKVDLVCSELGVDWEEFLQSRSPFLTREQAQILSKEGFCIGAHTMTHPDLRKVSEAEATREVISSVQSIAEITGADDIPFAFPWSGQGLCRRYLHRLRKEEPRLGLFFDTSGFARDDSIVVQRVTADHSPVVRGASNVVELVKVSYFNEGLRRLKYLLRLRRWD